MKLINALLTLNKEEWFSFRKYLLMNFREDSDVIQLFTEIQKSKLKLQDEKTMVRIKEKHFLGLSPKSFSNILSKIYQELENWLVFYDNAKNKLEHELQLVKSLNKRGLFKNASQIFHKMEKELLKGESMNMETNNMLHRLYHAQYYSDNPIKYRKPELFTHLLQAFKFTVHEKTIMYSTESINWGAIQKIDYTIDKEIFTQMRSILPSNLTTDSLGLLYEVIKNNDLEAFMTLYNKILQDEYELNTELITLIHLYMLHKGLGMINKNLITDPKILSTLLDKAFEAGTVMTNGKIPETRFINFLVNFHTTQSKSDATSFVKKWINSVNTKDIESTEKLAYSMIAFYYEDYSEIIEILKESLTTTPGIKVRSQLLLLIAYAENLEEYYELLDNAIENFHRQLRRIKSKLSNHIYTATYNTLKIIESVKDHKYTSKKIDLEKYQNILFRLWVMKKIKQGY